MTILAELRLFQSIRVGGGEENFFCLQRQPGVLIELHANYVSVRLEGDEVCTPLANVRSFKLAPPSPIAQRDTKPENVQKSGRTARITRTAAGEVGLIVEKSGNGEA